MRRLKVGSYVLFESVGTGPSEQEDSGQFGEWSCWTSKPPGLMPTGTI